MELVSGDACGRNSIGSECGITIQGMFWNIMSAAILNPATEPPWGLVMAVASFRVMLDTNLPKMKRVRQSV